jgi:hypothetical protein
MLWPGRYVPEHWHGERKYKKKLENPNWRNSIKRKMSLDGSVMQKKIEEQGVVEND